MSSFAAPSRRRHVVGADSNQQPRSSFVSSSDPEGLLDVGGGDSIDANSTGSSISDGVNRRTTSSSRSRTTKTIALIILGLGGLLYTFFYPATNPPVASPSTSSSSLSSSESSSLRKGSNGIIALDNHLMEVVNDNMAPDSNTNAEQRQQNIYQRQQQHHVTELDEDTGDRNGRHFDAAAASTTSTADADADATADAVATDDADDTTTSTTTTNPLFDKEYDNCIVGAGLSGSVIAENYANLLSQTSLIIERRHHIGGNCYDYIDEDTGIRVSLFGAHLFHTKHERVWDYVQRFGKWEDYEHRVLGLVNGKHVPIPVTIDTVNILFDLNITNSDEMDAWLEGEQVQLTDKHGKPREALNSEEVALTRVGPRLYNLIFKPYTYKQWAKYPEELGPEVLSRIPFRNNFDGRDFSDQYQALPKSGYTSLFEKMLDSPLITVVKNTDYFDVKDQLKCKRLYYTGPIDTYFADLKWPKLEYRSLSFERVVQKNTPGYFQPAPVVNYPQAEDVDGNAVDFTRIVEYKHLLNQTSKHTIYFIERSTDDGEPYYPVPNDVNKELYKKYQEMAEKEEGVTFVGRLANYKYFNMDDAILNALELFDRDTEDMK